MIAALIALMTVATPAQKDDGPRVEMVATVVVDKIVLHEQYEIVRMRGSDVYQRAVLRQFKFYHQGELIETLNDNAGKIRPLRINGEWWIVVKVGNETRIARTRCYEYLSTIKSDKEVAPAPQEQRQAA